jgi:[ribosomal protein S5]-alanine N-acetyltransferase
MLQTERLIVRLAERGDCGAIIDFYGSNREHLQPYGPLWPEDFLTKAFWHKQTDRHLEEFYTDQSARLFIFPVREPKVVIGNVSLGAIVRGAAQFCYLGYSIAKENEGQGLASEAAKSVIDYGFTSLNLHRIMANYIPTNERSGRLLTRLGFTIEGYARNYLNLNGQWCDHVMTSITNPNWDPDWKPAQN